VFAALKGGRIDLYPDYSGTVARELLKSEASDFDALNRGLGPLGLGVAVPLGFEDTYALAMLDSEAQRLGVQTIGDLAAHAQLRFGLSHEFLNRNAAGRVSPVLRSSARAAGWTTVLPYEEGGRATDVMDIYSTDAKIAKYKLRVLRRPAFLPRLRRDPGLSAGCPAAVSRAWAALQTQGRDRCSAMVTMNAQAELEGGASAIAGLSQRQRYGASGWREQVGFCSAVRQRLLGSPDSTCWSSCP
jgi:osmoprotectant transport system permease protein